VRVVIQRVSKASVSIDQQCHALINGGLLIFLGIENSDNNADIDYLCRKIVSLRIFDDEAGIMNLSVLDTGGDILCISQFTLHALTKKGNRPSYIRAARQEIAIPLYDMFCITLSECLGKPIKTGIFGADMQVELINDGPVTIWIDSKNKE